MIAAPVNVTPSKFLLEVDLQSLHTSPGSPSRAKARLSAYLGSPTKSREDLEQKLRAASERRQQQLKRKATSPAKKYTAMVTAKRALKEQVKKQEVLNDEKKVADAEAKRTEAQSAKAKKAGNAYKHALKVCAEQKLIMALALKAKQEATQAKQEAAAVRHEHALAQKKASAERFARLNLDTFQTKQKQQSEDLSKKLEDKIAAATVRKTEQQSQRLAFNQIRNSRAEVVVESRAKAELQEETNQKAKEERQQRAESLRSSYLSTLVAKAAEQNEAAKETGQEIRKQRQKESQHLQEFMTEKQAQAATRRQQVIDAKKAKAIEAQTSPTKRGKGSTFGTQECKAAASTAFAAVPPTPPTIQVPKLEVAGVRGVQLEVVGVTIPESPA